MVKYDIVTGIINGIEIGSSIDRHILPTDSAQKILGYHLRLERNLVDSLFICFLDGYEGYPAFHGTIYKCGTDTNITCESQPDDIKRIFPVPFNQWNDGVDESLSFQIGPYDLDFSWTVTRSGLRFTYLIVDFDPKRVQEVSSCNQCQK